MELHSIVFKEHLLWFQKELEVKGLRSSKNYLFAVREFLHWLEGHDHKNLSRVNHKKVKSYFIYQSNRTSIKSGRRLTETTINEKFSAIDKFYDFLLISGAIKKAPFIPKYGYPKFKERPVPSQFEVNEMFERAVSQRELVILSLAYGCGLRRSEIVHLDVHDIDFLHDLIVIKESKCRRTREVLMANEVKENLQNYINGERFSNVISKNLSEKALILNNQGTRISGEMIYGDFKRTCRRSNVKAIKEGLFVLHSLRHAIGTHMVDNGADIHFVRKFLGHSEINTTYQYIKKSRIRGKHLV